MKPAEYIADALQDCVCGHQKIQHSKKRGWPCLIGNMIGEACYCKGFIKK